MDTLHEFTCTTNFLYPLYLTSAWWLLTLEQVIK